MSYQFANNRVPIIVRFKCLVRCGGTHPVRPSRLSSRHSGVARELLAASLGVVRSSKHYDSINSSLYA